MKEYRLAAWPKLRAPFDRIAHRRMLSTMSHRHVSFAQLVEAGGLPRPEVRAFIDQLVSDGWAEERETGHEPPSLFGSLRPLGRWLRRAFHATSANP